MHSGRRKVLQGTGGLAVMGLAMAAGLLGPGLARAEGWNKAAFETKSFADAVKAMGGSQPVESKDISIESPDIAENGAVVPFTIASRLPGTESIALRIEKNPNRLAAGFGIPAGRAVARGAPARAPPRLRPEAAARKAPPKPHSGQPAAPMIE